MRVRILQYVDEAKLRAERIGHGKAVRFESELPLRILAWIGCRLLSRIAAWQPDVEFGAASSAFC